MHLLALGMGWVNNADHPGYAKPMDSLNHSTAAAALSHLSKWKQVLCGDMRTTVDCFRVP